MLAPSFLAFFILYSMSFVVAIGFWDWFMVWVGLEMNMMSFLMLIYSRDSSNCLEALYKYFFIQGISSGLFIVMMFTGGSISLVLSIKMAAGPFFFWFPSVMKGLNWFSCFMLMSFQKLLPLTLLSVMGGWVSWMVGLSSLMIGALGSFNQSKMQKLMAFSSVNHLGWMILAQMLNNNLWMTYFVIYVLIMVPMVQAFWSGGVTDLMGNFKKGIFMLMMVMNLGGLPPMVGFVIKWMVLVQFVMFDKLTSVMMVVSSLVMLYIYFRIVYDMMMGGKVLFGWSGDMNYRNFYVLMTIIMGVSYFPLIIGMLF